jgi:hypothetical protein
LEGSRFKASLSKKFMRTVSTNKKLGVVMHASHPSYAGSINRKVAVQVDLSINTRPYSKTN